MDMKEELLKCRNEGMGFRQLVQVGKAITEGLPIENIANVELSVEEMKEQIEIERKKKKQLD